MAIAKLDEKYNFLPLRSHMNRAVVEDWEIMDIQVNTLLSKIKGLDRAIVEKLESMGVYDSTEFMIVQNQIIDYININITELQEFADCIVKEIRSIPIDPNVNLEMRENYVLLATFSDSESNALSLISGDLMMSWSNPISEGWNLVKYAFDKAMGLLDSPEILGSTFFHDDIPNWFIMNDLSTYMSGLDPLLDLYSQSDLLGFPQNPSLGNAIDNAQDKVLRLCYILNLAKKS